MWDRTVKALSKATGITHHASAVVLAFCFYAFNGRTNPVGGTGVSRAAADGTIVVGFAGQLDSTQQEQSTFFSKTASVALIRI